MGYRRPWEPLHQAVVLRTPEGSPEGVSEALWAALRLADAGVLETYSAALARASKSSREAAGLAALRAAFSLADSYALPLASAFARSLAARR